jgi:cell division protease FtsH
LRRATQEANMLDKPSGKRLSLGERVRELLRIDGQGNKADPTPRGRLPKEPQERKRQFATWYVFIAFLGLMLIQYIWLQNDQVETIPYSEFEQLLADNKISDVLVGSDTMQGTLKEPLPDGRKLFYTVRVDPDLAAKLQAHGVKITGAPSSNWLSTILSWALPIFVFYLIWIYAVRRMAERQGLGGVPACPIPSHQT